MNSVDKSQEVCNESKMDTEMEENFTVKEKLGSSHDGSVLMWPTSCKKVPGSPIETGSQIRSQKILGKELPKYFLPKVPVLRNPFSKWDDSFDEDEAGNSENFPNSQLPSTSHANKRFRKRARLTKRADETSQRTPITIYQEFQRMKGQCNSQPFTFLEPINESEEMYSDVTGNRMEEDAMKQDAQKHKDLSASQTEEAGLRQHETISIGSPQKRVEENLNLQQLCTPVESINIENPGATAVAPDSRKKRFIRPITKYLSEDFKNLPKAKKTVQVRNRAFAIALRKMEPAKPVFSKDRDPNDVYDMRNYYDFDKISKSLSENRKELPVQKANDNKIQDEGKRKTAQKKNEASTVGISSTALVGIRKRMNAASENEGPSRKKKQVTFSLVDRNEGTYKDESAVAGPSRFFLSSACSKPTVGKSPNKISGSQKLRHPNCYVKLSKLPPVSSLNDITIPEEEVSHFKRSARLKEKAKAKVP